MTTYYVSNAASNGYSSGNDSNNGTSKSTPFLTIAHANGVSVTGDVIIINPSSTEYNETAGSGYIGVGSNVTIHGDPTLLPLRPKVKGSSTSYLFVNLSSGGMTLENMMLDAQTNALTPVVCFGNSTTIRNLSAYNLGTGGGVTALINVQTGSGVSQTVIVDKCDVLASNGNGSGTNLLFYYGNGTSNDCSITVTGSTANGVQNFVYGNSGSPGASLKSLTIGASSDNTRCNLTSCQNGIAFATTGATIGTVSITATDFVNCTQNTINANTFDYTSVINSLTLSNCAFSGTQSVNYNDITFGFQLVSGTICYNQFSTNRNNIVSYTTLTTNLTLHDNTYSNNNTSTIGSIWLVPCGAGLTIYNENVTSNGAHAILVGADTPQTSSASNVTASTGTHNFGDTGSNTYISQPFTWCNINDGGQNYPCYLEIPFNAVGSPTGNITCKLYTDNGGVPGTLMDTSVYTASAANINSYSLGNPTTFRFWFEGRQAFTAGSVYHIVLQYLGTIDGSNYMTLPTNTPAATTNGGVVGTMQISASGSTWAAATGYAALYTLTKLNLECTQPKIHNCTLNGTGAATHNIIVGATDGALVYDNYVSGSDIGVIFKQVDGSVNNAIAYNNLVYASNNSGNAIALYDKGSKQAKFYNNTVVVNATAGIGIYAINDYIGNTGWYNGTPSRSVQYKNNIIYVEEGEAYGIGGEPTSPTPGGYGYQITNPTIDYNCVYVASGAFWGIYNLGQSATTSTLSSFAALQALGFEAHGINADPLLANEPAPSTPINFIPASNSPALGLGVAISGISTDYFGTTWTNPPTVGACNPLSRTFGNRSYANNRTLIN